MLSTKMEVTFYWLNLCIRPCLILLLTIVFFWMLYRMLHGADARQLLNKWVGERGREGARQLSASGSLTPAATDWILGTREQLLWWMFFSVYSSIWNVYSSVLSFLKTSQSDIQSPLSANLSNFWLFWRKYNWYILTPISALPLLERMWLRCIKGNGFSRKLAHFRKVWIQLFEIAHFWHQSRMIIVRNEDSKSDFFSGLKI